MNRTTDVGNADAQKSVAADVPVVGIGASAGGIAVLRTLLPLLEPGGGAAFVIVLHLDPKRRSILTALLARVARLPVVEAVDQMEIAADHVYVIPPNATLTITDDHLNVGPVVEERGRRAPIDAFLLSLARAKGGRAAGIILSGLGSDGTLGLRAVKEQGGLTLAQQDAEHDGMMRSVMNAGIVDFVLPVDRMPARLCDFFRRHSAPGGRQGVGDRSPIADAELAEIAVLLRARTGHDFSGYKYKTVGRRVLRRMNVLQIDNVRDFINHLRKVPQEIDALQDLLIGVTNFFRDPAAFEALERQVIPHLFEGKGPDDVVRVWVPGCSTGEEAYSIAILLREHMLKGQSGGTRLQIFASDIDEEALLIARAGRFPATIASDVPASRLERHFVREDGTYLIAADLRDLCLFSSHNLLNDAPFSRLDLISCRNLLIYLTPELQNRVIPLFHYALKESGFLFLGASENVTRHARLFSIIDKAHRIFRRRPVVERLLPEFPLSSRVVAGQQPAAGEPPGDGRESLQSLAERQLLERYAPAYLVINADGDLLHGSSRTGKYLELSAGVPRLDVFSMARDGLRPDLRTAVHKAVNSGQAAIQRNIVIGTNGGRQTIDLVVQPIRPDASQEALYMVIFHDVGGIRDESEAEMPGGDDGLVNTSLHQLELELRATKERLQSTTEELESSNEELRSGNEELSSMNEELQSANEELETSKEELQSINQELQTVNAELNLRVDELSRANSDIANLLENTQIATLFLDQNLALKNFTPAAEDLFHLIDGDIGRPITHIRPRFNADTVEEDAKRVLRTLSSIERKVEGGDNGTRYVMRMMPYRTLDDVIAGVVMTFVDITKITAAEARIDDLTVDLCNRVQSLESLIDLVPVGVVIVHDIDSGEIKVNRAAAQLMGEPAAEGPGPRPTGRMRLFSGGRELPEAEQPLQRAFRSGEVVQAVESRLVRPDGSSVDVMMSATPLRNEQGALRGGIAVLVDISERKRAEAHQQVLLHELQHRVKNILATISALATRMLRGAPSVDGFSSAFLGRLRSMAATHELLSQANWAGADLRQLLETTLRGQNPSAGAIHIEGPAVLLTPAAVSTLGMVIFEMATNAAKYGALSSAQGRIEIGWTVVRDPAGDRLQLCWTELAGPPVPATLADGFGVTFIKRGVEYELQGSAVVEPHPDGLSWELVFPLKANVKDA